MQQRLLAEEIDGVDKLCERMKDADTVRDWSFILQDYIQFGNRKLDDSVAIFNLGSAKECVNLGTEHCQVAEDECYARQSEKTFPGTLEYRDKQEFLWDCMPADLFAEAFVKIVERKRKPVLALRFNQSGDIRHQGDVTRLETVAFELSKHDIMTYTYTASDFLDYEDASSLTINASNGAVEHADQRYIAVDTVEDIPEDGFHCPYDRDNGKDVKCGECMACIHDGGSSDVYIVIH